MEYTVDFQESIQNAFLEYGASVAQERSIIDVRDGLKIGMRQTLYAQYSNKLTHKNPFKKAQKSVAAATSQSYVHGDAACYSTLIRAAKPWAYRYPLEEAQGSYGTQCGPDTESAARYVEARSSELADVLFDGLKKNTIEEWYMNYDDTEEIPAVFPSIGFWNLVNGTTGIAVGMGCSVPQFNLKEVNNALIKLINNPNIDFNEIYCCPDFCCGGTIVNAAEVKESLRTGKGKAIRIRAKLEYDSKLNVIKATELPYGVFTDTVIEQIAKAVDKDENYGVEKVVDHTKQFADIWIYLSKEAIPSIMIQKLYHDTSLENWFGVNMNMLDMGRFPRIFGWKEACQAYVNHIRDCKIRELQYNLDTLMYKVHIAEGLLMAIARIEEIIATIRSSNSTGEAKQSLMDIYGFDEEQAKAILDIKLQRLAHLEGVKINEEREKNLLEIDNLNYILNSEQEINKILIERLEYVANKFGDARRTKVVNTIGAEEDEEVETEVLLKIADKKVSIATKKLNNVISTTNKENLYGISEDGKLYNLKVKILMSMKTAASYYSLFKIKDIINVFTDSQINTNKYIILITKNGYIKKILAKEYMGKIKQGAKATKLKPDDSIKTILFVNNDTTIPVNYNGKDYTINTINIAISSKESFGTKIEKCI